MSNSIKDIQISIDTGEGVNSITTKKINGHLLAIIVKSNESLQLHIISEIGHTLLQMSDIKGVHYIPLGAKMIDNQFHSARESWTEYVLDEKIKIIVAGGKNQKATIILRVN